jgi:aryl-alcohol dehydrogenase-like predicted oxidoreductase
MMMLSAKLGLGTRLGSEDAATDSAMGAVVMRALRAGVRVIDTAVNYRAGRSEAALGQAVRAALRDGVVSRDELMICTKGGYARPTIAGLRTSLPPEDLGAFGHSFSPAYLRYQLELSLTTLNLGRIDVYYLHNLEEQCQRLDQAGFMQTMRAAFDTLESAVAQRLIGSYGVSTWAGVWAGSPWSLAEIKQIAADVARDRYGTEDHLTHAQGPLSLRLRAALVPGHAWGGKTLSFVSLCQALGITFVASASAGSGHIPALAAASVHWVRRIPGVGVALVSTLSIPHLEALVA